MVEAFDGLLPRFRRGQGGVVVIEKLHGASQEGTLVIQPQDFKPAPAHRQDVQTAVRILAQDLADGCGAARVHNSLLIGQHHAELQVAADRLLNHFLIALFENVQRQLGFRQQHHLKRKQRQPFLHATIMAFARA